MIAGLLSYGVLVAAIGAVTLVLSEPLERPFGRELAHYAWVVGGSILALTIVVVVLTLLFV
ncbi:MAG: hypothetical protein ACO4BJ_06645 [Planctomycetota bacterium]|jgi:hypothetical protein